MAKCIYKSYKTIAVLSNNFLRSGYCNYELQVATHRLAEKKDHSVVVIRIDNASCSGLPTELSKRTFIDYSSSLEKASWKRKLLKFLSVDEEHDLRESTKTNNAVTEETNNNFKNKSSRNSSSSSYSNANTGDSVILFKELSVERLI